MSDHLHNLRRVRDVSDNSSHHEDLEHDQQSIIDVFEFDDTADDRWLCSVGSRRSSVAENKIEDLDAWLHAETPESEVSNFENGSRRPIDTRTFVRIKRKSARLSFEDTESSVSSEPKPFSLSNVWKKQTNLEISPQNSSIEKEQNSSRERRDSVPMMLRPKSNQVLSALMSESPSSISSQTSMEAFKNLAHSKEGLNSLLSDISDPDISSILMNISQPSFFCTSIIADEKGDDNNQNIKSGSLTDSQILTDSMMENSMFEEMQDSRLLSDFLKQDCTILKNKNCKNANSFKSDDETFTFENLDTNETFVTTENGMEKIYPSPRNENEINITQVLSSQENTLGSNQTFTNFGSSLNSTRTISSQENSLNTTQIISKPPNLKDKSRENSLNSTQIISKTPTLLNATEIIFSNHDKPELQKITDILSATQNLDPEEKTDLTFEKNMNQIDTTSDFHSYKTYELNEPNEKESNSLDSTFEMPSLREQLLQEVQKSNENKFDSTFTRLDKGKNIEISTGFGATLTRKNLLPTRDITNLQAKLDPRKCLNETFNKTQINSKLSNAGDSREMNSITNRKSLESRGNTLDQNRFNTFKKESKFLNNFPKESFPQENNLNETMTVEPQLPATVTKTNNNLYQQRFNTFLKKSGTFNKKSLEENETVEKFVKPKQIQLPRQLTKLPQLFQKSNPNLGSNSKLFGKISSDPNFGFNKGSQPNISNNMYSLGRHKSEQRLMQAKLNPEFSSGDGTSQSMESIESTSSAHSAPDLDERCSVKSDYSHKSYTVKPKNLEALKKLANEDKIENKISGSTPRVKGRQVLENTWVAEKDLPSPILKNGSDRFGNGGSIINSPTDTSEYTAKTSSPLLSPTHSNQAINAMLENDVRVIEATKENIQVTENVEVKQIKSSGIKNVPRQLRQPTNYPGTNKVANGASSGIPRPASRIPGPRFARPNPK